MIQALAAVLGGALSALAFPRFGPGVLVVPGMALFLWSLRRVENAGRGALVGAIYGLTFFFGTIWWMAELGLIALIPLVLVLSAYSTLFGWWMGAGVALEPRWWLASAVGGWGVLELIRYNFPFSGLEWGAAGYALSDLAVARGAASVIGTSGLTILVVALAASLVLLVEGSRSAWVWGALGSPLLAMSLGAVVASFPTPNTGAPVRVAIVQGSTPCPFEHCANERFLTYEQHLELTRTIEAGSVDLVVWSEGSTGAANADPVQNPEVGAAISDEARRIGAWMLVGSDRPISEENWVNVNVVFDDEGAIVGEYQKQQGVPFGEFIPFRPLFDWIPELSQVPRDMIPGTGPVVFDAPFATFGSVISFEGSFARYSLQHARLGARLLVVATNEGSYGHTPASDQLIGMTRMRAAELGLPVVHSAVTGKSVVIDREGGFVSDFSGLGTQEIVYGEVDPGYQTVFAIAGDWLLYTAALLGLLVAWRRWRLLVSEE